MSLKLLDRVQIARAVLLFQKLGIGNRDWIRGNRAPPWSTNHRAFLVASCLRSLPFQLFRGRGFWFPRFPILGHELGIGLGINYLSAPHVGWWRHNLRTINKHATPGHDELCLRDW